MGRLVYCPSSKGSLEGLSILIRTHILFLRNDWQNTSIQLSQHPTNVYSALGVPVVSQSSFPVRSPRAPLCCSGDNSRAIATAPKPGGGSSLRAVRKGDDHPADLITPGRVDWWVVTNLTQDRWKTIRTTLYRTTQNLGGVFFKSWIFGPEEWILRTLWRSLHFNSLMWWQVSCCSQPRLPAHATCACCRCFWYAFRDADPTDSITHSQVLTAIRLQNQCPKRKTMVGAMLRPSSPAKSGRCHAPFLISSRPPNLHRAQSTPVAASVPVGPSGSSRGSARRSDHPVRR